MKWTISNSGISHLSGLIMESWFISNLLWVIKGSDLEFSTSWKSHNLNLTWPTAQNSGQKFFSNICFYHFIWSWSWINCCTPCHSSPPSNLLHMLGVLSELFEEFLHSVYVTRNGEGLDWRHQNLVFVRPEHIRQLNQHRINHSLITQLVIRFKLSISRCHQGVSWHPQKFLEPNLWIKDRPSGSHSNFCHNKCRKKLF